jgi:hypothetical protein
MKLLKVETGKKSAKFLYSIVDENGNVLSTRSSNREYVAATKCGTFFFGRLDLIGKGDHGRFIKDITTTWAKVENKPGDEIIYGTLTISEWLEDRKIMLEHFQTIATI